MGLTDLASQAALDARFQENYHLSGQFEGTAMHFPCPFCGARDWYEVVMLEFGEHMDPHYCVECGRSARFVFTRNGGDALSAELVQCYGPDAPTWMTFPPRREDVKEPASSEGRMVSPPPRTLNLRVEVKRERPPGFRKTSSKKVNCHTCKSVNRRTGFCAKFMLKVHPSDVCDKWTRRSS